MSGELVAAIAVVVLLVLIATEVPIALALMGSGILGLVLLGQDDNITSILGSTAYSSTAKYALFVICMYVLLGALISNAGIGVAIYRSVNRLVGRLPGGLAATAVGATTLFSGISGSSAADVAAFGRISVNEMARHGYRREYAAAVVAAAGAFAALIPPAIGFVLYGIIAEESISALIFAGIVPGILSCLLLALFVILRARFSRGERRAEFGGRPAEPAAQVTATRTFEARGMLSRFAHGDAWGIVYAIIIFAIVVGGLYSGQFTATEAGAIGVVVAAVITVIEVLKRRSSLFQTFSLSLRESVGTSSMIFLLIVGGGVFGYMITLSGLPRALTHSIESAGFPPLAVAGLMLLLLIPLGMVLDGLTLMLVVVPLVAPIVEGLGLDGVWFGVLVLKTVEIGLITPPVGLNVFIISAATGAKVEAVFRFLVPFVVLDLTFTAVLFMFPEIVLWLPRAVGLL
jgi:C4-dicarboxylate transporter, DctM subunit